MEDAWLLLPLSRPDRRIAQAEEALRRAAGPGHGAVSRDAFRALESFHRAVCVAIAASETQATDLEGPRASHWLLSGVRKVVLGEVLYASR